MQISQLHFGIIKPEQLNSNGLTSLQTTRQSTPTLNELHFTKFGVSKSNEQQPLSYLARRAAIDLLNRERENPGSTGCEPDEIATFPEIIRRRTRATTTALTSKTSQQIQPLTSNNRSPHPERQSSEPNFWKNLAKRCRQERRAARNASDTELDTNA